MMNNEPIPRTVVGFDAVVRPGAKPGEHIISHRERLCANGTVEAAASVLGCKRDAVVRLIKQGKIVATKPTSRYVVDMLTVYQYRDASRIQGPTSNPQATP